MTATALWQNARWQVVLPEQSLTPAQLAIVDRDPTRGIDRDAAAAMLEAYRRARSALWQVARSRGFQVSFAVEWEPDEDAVGEPDPIAGAARVVQVFGRDPQAQVSPVRAMAQPRKHRSYLTSDPDRIAALSDALAAPLVDGAEITVPGPSDAECDGCWPDVLTSQERWRADGVRVIRPRHVLIDPQVIVLPLRHVVSFGDLTAEELSSLFARLDEVRHQFGLASGSTGLSCFANDGTAARQETPHVHLHVFGRAADEADNPFVLLGRRLS